MEADVLVQIPVLVSLDFQDPNVQKVRIYCVAGCVVAVELNQSPLN